MALGAVAIALSSATEREHSSWQDAAEREGTKYGVEGDYVRASMEGREMKGRRIEGIETEAVPLRRSWIDWALIVGTTGIFVALASVAQLPRVDFSLGWAVAVTLAMLWLMVSCALALWRTTKFR
jgi:hypothetical protein